MKATYSIRSLNTASNIQRTLSCVYSFRVHFDAHFFNDGSIAHRGSRDRYEQPPPLTRSALCQIHASGDSVESCRKDAL